MSHRSPAAETILRNGHNGHDAEFRSVSRRVELFTPEQRRAKGRAQRVAVPRMAHESFQKSAYRPDPVETLIQQGENRLQHVLPIRYGRMLASPFAFFRGSAAIMAWDLSHSQSTNLSAQLCGDAHVSNFGFFGLPERVVMLDMNDFDETVPGPFEWDVKRLAASVVLAGRNMGLSDSRCQDVAQACVRQYRKSLTEFSEMTTLDVWYSYVTTESLLDLIPNMGRRKDIVARMEKARSKDSHHAAAALADSGLGELRIVERPPLVVRLSDEEVEAVVRPIFETYIRTLSDDRRTLLERFRYVDSATRVDGVGSVGVRSYIVVLTGKDASDRLVLQLKEAVGSVLAQYVRSSPYRNEGERIVQGQRLTQSVSDPFLGWVRHTTGRDFYIRQLFSMTASAEPTSMEASLYSEYAVACGKILARAHARSGDLLQISAYLGKNEQFDEAVARFAMRYADQTEEDHMALVEAVRWGKIEAETAV